MQKIRKILWAVSEKTSLPTKQPSNQATNQPINGVCKEEASLNQGIRKIKFSSSIENATANKVTTKCKKQWNL